MYKAIITAIITGVGRDSCVPDDPKAVDASIYIDGREVGAVTLLPAEDGRPVYEAWGDLSHWADWRIQNLVMDDDEVMGSIELAVTEAMHLYEGVLPDEC